MREAATGVPFSNLPPTSRQQNNPLLLCSTELPRRNNTKRPAIRLILSRSRIS